MIQERVHRGEARGKKKVRNLLHWFRQEITYVWLRWWHQKWRRVYISSKGGLLGSEDAELETEYEMKERKKRGGKLRNERVFREKRTSCF